MAAYVLMCIVEITDLEVYDEFSRRAPATVEPHGGRILLAGGAADIVDGSWHPVFPILIEFPNRQQAREWYESGDYQPLKIFGRSGMKMNAVIMEGLVRRFSGGLRLVE